VVILWLGDMHYTKLFTLPQIRFYLSADAVGTGAAVLLCIMLLVEGSIDVVR
jgi:hypothetical protein